MDKRERAVAIVSGGLDSVTLAYLLDRMGYKLHLLSFDYGQRHKKELEFAEQCARDLHADHDIINLTGITHLLKGSSLTDSSVDVPEGHYAAPEMALTVVPNRNAMMLSIAYAVAVAEQASRVGIGVHGGDHFIYPDCRPAFIGTLNLALNFGNEGFVRADGIQIYTPFLNSTKAQIVEQGRTLGVPFRRTWSCYKGGNLHCGKCGTCVERIEAFKLAGVYDPTWYELDVKEAAPGEINAKAPISDS